MVVRVESIVTGPISASHLIDLKGFQEFLIGNTQLLTRPDQVELPLILHIGTAIYKPHDCHGEAQ